MALEIINAGESGGEVRNKLNANFEYIEDLINSLNTGNFKGLVDATTVTIPNPNEGDWYLIKYYSAYNQTIVPMGNLVINAGELCFVQYLNNDWSKFVITNNIGGGSGGTMTGAEISAELQTLSGASRLPKLAVRSAEAALNYLGTYNFHDLNAAPSFDKGDFVIHSGASSVYVAGDWAIALVEDPNTTNLTTSEWLIIPFGKWTSGFTVDINGNVTFNKNVKVLGSAYSDELISNIANPTDEPSIITPNFSDSNVFSFQRSTSLTFNKPTGLANGQSFIYVITATANITISFDSNYLGISSLSLQPTQIVIISGVVSNGRLICVSGTPIGGTQVQNPPVLTGVAIAATETILDTITIVPTFNGGGTPTAYAVREDTNGVTGTFGTWVTYTSGNITYELTNSNEGTKRLYVKFKNSDNEESATQYDEIIYIVNPANVASISINAGAGSTNSTVVQITLNTITGLGTKEIRLSNDDATWTSWTSYTTGTVSHTLTAGAGSKTVYLQIRNIAGASTSKSDTIIYQTVNYPALESIEINSGATETNDREVVITYTLGDGTTPVEYSIKEGSGSWSAPAAIPSDEEIPYEIVGSGDGIKTIYLKLYDDESTPNESPEKSSTIKVVENVPTLSNVFIDGGAAETTDLQVSITLIASGQGAMELALAESIDGLDDSTSWSAFSLNNEAQFTLASGANGTRTVYAKLRNIAGDSAVVADSIILNQPAAVELLTVLLDGVSGGGTTTDEIINVTFTATGTPTQYLISESDTFAGAIWTAITSPILFTLSTGNNQKTIYFKVRRVTPASESAVVIRNITMAIPSPTLTSITLEDESNGIIITTVATNAYKMKVIDLATAGLPDWNNVAWVDYDSTYYYELSATGNRVVYIQIQSYGGGTVTDFVEYVDTVNYELTNTFKLGVANNTSLITDGFYGWASITPDAAVQIKNTSGATVSENGNVISLQIDSSGITPNKSSGTLPANLDFTNFPTAVLGYRIIKNFASGVTRVPIVFKLFNLNNNDKYSFRFCSTVDNINRFEPITFTVTGTEVKTATLDVVKNNLSTEIYIEDVSPVNGEIYFQYVNTYASAAYVYQQLNAWIIEQYKPQ